MRKRFSACAAVLALFFIASATYGSQADDTTITIQAQTPGPTVFISQLTLQASDASAVSSIQFTISPKAASVTRPLSGTYSQEYLLDRGYIDLTMGTIFLPVYGLYANYLNTVTLTYNFSDGSQKQATTTITTGALGNPCSYAIPTILQPRVPDAFLSYDFFLVRGACDASPAIMDTDGEIRWTSPFNTNSIREGSSTFYDNAIYLTRDSLLYRVDLDGTVTAISDYSSMGFVNFHHNIDRGKVGMVLDVDTDQYLESVNVEVDKSGNILKTWNLADIISAAMLAGGDDPSQFVGVTPEDWFHNNATAYRRSDNTLIVSSREDFVIGLDYDTKAIKWILGDSTKQWFLFPSLAQFALTLPSGTIPPVGQHAVSVTLDDNIFLMDNGRNSEFHEPPGVNHDFSFPRSYVTDLENGTATELFEYPGVERVYSDFCGSAYEDAKSNYLVDYAYIDTGTSARILGYNAAGVKVFDYQYASGGCANAYNSLPLHLETTKFPSVGPQSLNLSTRAAVGTGDDVLIGGFIVTGNAPKRLILRVLGPSLANAGLTMPLADPVLTVYDATGAVVAMNDNWESDAGAAEITANRLAPADPAEAATVVNLEPGSYTTVVSGSAAGTGVALFEAFDLSPTAGSVLANLSARGFVGTGDNVLIGGFIVGDVASSTVVLRVLGPSLSSDVVTQPLADPSLTVYDGNGFALASNDNWQNDPNATDVEGQGLAPGDSAEAALLLNLPAGSYTAIASGNGGSSGVALFEVYNLE